MPTPIPPLTFTHAAQVHACAHGGLDVLKGQIQANLTRDFGLNEEEPDVDDLLDIFFHTFEAEDGQEFLIRPSGDSLLVDLCEREERRIPGNSDGFERIAVPMPFTAGETDAIPDIGAMFGAVPSEVTNLSPDLQRVLARINELGSLKAGWLDGKGREVTSLAVATATYVLLKRPDILGMGLGTFPTGQGGITLEFRKDGWSYSIEVLSTGSIEWYGVEEGGQGLIEPIPYLAGDASFLTALDERIGPKQEDAGSGPLS